MPTSHRRRVLALSASGGLVTALACLPAGPASALVPTAVYAAQGSSSAATGCTVTSGSDFASTQKNLVNGRAKGAVNLITTWTNTSNSADVTSVTGHYSGSTHLVRQHGAFRSATLTGAGRLTITRALGSSSTCDTSAQVLNVMESITKQPAGWYYVTRSTTDNSLTEIAVAADPTLVKPAIFEVYQGGSNTVTERAFVPKGSYVTVLAAGIESGDFKPLNTKNGSVSRGRNTNSMSAVFRNAGSALGRSAGSAGQFVKFPASVSCSHHSATLTWRSGASKVASGSFFVNGSKKASVSNPVAGHSVVLRHLGPTADNKITAKLSLKAGGHPTATRMYVPCKG